MEVVKLVKYCIENFNLDVNKLRDIAFAICIADKLTGTNQRELDIDKFVESSDELEWDSVLSLFNITSQNRGCSSLPRVQKLRVISDVLSLSVCNEVSGLKLSCIASKKVAKQLGVSLESVDYADENVCYGNLSKIQSHLSSVSVDLSNLTIIYNKLCIYSDKIISIGGFDLPIAISNILIPDKIFNNLGKKCTIEDLNKFLEKNDLTIDDYSAYIVDIYCYEIVQEIAKLLNKRYAKNEVEFNLILTRLDNFAGSYLPMGTYSLNGYTQRLSVLRNVPSYLARKVNVVFSESSPFSEMTILGCISVLYFLRKINIKKDYFTSEMEGLLNECRK